MVEHFFNPYDEFDKINNLLDNNSWFGVMTTFLPKDELLKTGIIEEIQHMLFFIKRNFSIY